LNRCPLFRFGPGVASRSGAGDGRIGKRQFGIGLELIEACRGVDVMGFHRRQIDGLQGGLLLRRRQLDVH
jgi:hypothetical protein